MYQISGKFTPLKDSSFNVNNGEHYSVTLLIMLNGLHTTDTSKTIFDKRLIPTVNDVDPLNGRLKNGIVKAKEVHVTGILIFWGSNYIASCWNFNLSLPTSKVTPLLIFRGKKTILLLAELTEIRHRTKNCTNSPITISTSTISLQH